MDRGHPKLAPQVDALNPAVLGLIADCRAQARTPPAAGSGCAAAPPPTSQAVPLLIGLGVDEL